MLVTRDIPTIRAQLAALRAQINAESEAEFLRRGATLTQELEDTVYAMHNNGISLNKIAQVYGTKNWRTVKELYVAAQSRRSGAETLGATPVTTTTYSDAGTVSVSLTDPAVQGYTVTVAPGWVSMTEEPYAGTVGVRLRPEFGAVLAWNGGHRAYPMNTPLHKELGDWRNRKDSAVVQMLLQVSGLTE